MNNRASYDDGRIDAVMHPWKGNFNFYYAYELTIIKIKAVQLTTNTQPSNKELLVFGVLHFLVG